MKPFALMILPLAVLFFSVSSLVTYRSADNSINRGWPISFRNTPGPEYDNIQNGLCMGTIQDLANPHTECLPPTYPIDKSNIAIDFGFWLLFSTFTCTVAYFIYGAAKHKNLRPRT